MCVTADARDCINKEFLDFDDDSFITYEEWLDSYSEDKETEKEYEAFRARNITLNDFALRHAIPDGKKYF